MKVMESRDGVGFKQERTLGVNLLLFTGEIRVNLFRD